MNDDDLRLTIFESCCRSKFIFGTQTQAQVTLAIKGVVDVVQRFQTRSDVDLGVPTFLYMQNNPALKSKQGVRDASSIGRTDNS